MGDFMLKNRYLTILMLLLVAVVGAGGIFFKQYTKNEPAGEIDFPEIPFYTVMIYMNGSDLESEFGAATDDLVEMLDSGLDSRNANVLILTGGASRWQNAAIPDNECIIWQLEDGFLNKLESMGRVSMGEPATLRDFTMYSMENFPAQKYGLIMWDHGGGSIAGFGHDEKFNDASLTLLDMKKAFHEAGLADKKLEFLGFDACLMATVEMAILASDFAHVLIASEDLEPGEGWDYNFLAALNQNICGFALGEIIVDTFIEYFERAGLAEEEILTLSVIDLSKVEPVMRAMGLLMSHEITFDLFHQKSHRRYHTKTFGEGSPRDNYADMVDIGDMAIQLADMFPFEAAAVLRALENCVTYNRHNSDVEIYGLSTYYIYGGKSEGIPSLRTYSALQMNPTYTAFLHNFFQKLTTQNPEIIHSEKILLDENDHIIGISQEETPTLWPQIHGHPVPLYPISTTKEARRYAIPILVNNKDADIIVLISPAHPQGKILGIRHNNGSVFQKGHDPINPSDNIAFLYQTPDSWAYTPPITITATTLDWLPSPHKTATRHTTICNDHIYSL
jgi:hypothetical protein